MDTSEAIGEDRPHVAAFAGIVALAVLGGSLIVRNRLAGGGATAPREEVVTDRERVRRLLVDHGGRMRQSEIVDSVEWSKAKVSRLLADLEADGEITKLRLGRENLICLPGHEPRASRPPHTPDP
nr:helix-turn-helix domain-containing protein [Saliphagus sp. LR7]